jgi:HK97 family phage prohead protease
MIIRTKGGEYRAGTTDVLFGFLGVKSEGAGPQKVAGDVELIASVPFKLAMSDGIAANPDGIAWTLSTFDLDRYDERIDPAGWDYKRYRDNPVVEWAHRYDIPAIGKIEGLTADDNGLHGVVIFNDKDYDPFGWAIGQRVKAGVIRAGSVGFRVIEIEIPKRANSNEQLAKSKEDGATLIFRKQELLEFSICNVPAKPFALAKTIREGKAETKQELGGSMFWGGLINNF